MSRWIRFGVLAVWLATVCAAATDRFPADHERIRYCGRFTDDYRFNWSGSLIEFSTDASSIKARLELVEGAAAGMTVVMDGQARFLKLEKGRSRYELAEDLAPGRHHIQLFKRSEATKGTVRFLGLELSEGARLFPVEAPVRRLLVIGDSITCGYANEEPDRNKGNSVENENGWLAYSPIAARELGADLMMVCRSGHGMFRNRSINNDRENTLPQLFERTLWLAEKPAWNHARYVPDAVIINFGTNDNSTNGGKEPLRKEDFAGAYTAFLERIRAVYPESHIILSIGPMTLEPISDWLPEIAEPFENTSLLVYPRYEGDEDIGGHWHPSVSKHRKMAEKLVQKLKTEMDWK